MIRPDTLTEVDDDVDSPWYGIPIELINGADLYDTDSAGGCG
ncbi:hypothetical protein ACQPYK_35775 [Streptosporangium sp. CA-135522]